MKGIHAVPVYKNIKLIRKTIAQSLHLIEKGKNVLIFPERLKAWANNGIGDFYKDFLNWDRLYCQHTKKALPIVHVAVNKKTKTIEIGMPIPFDPNALFHAEKIRLKRELEETMPRMYHEMEGIIPH